MAKSKKLMIKDDELMAITHLELINISPDENNPRKSYSGTEMLELIDSVREKGVLQPIIVRAFDDGFKIVAGERRYRAAVSVQAANKSRNTIPVIIRDLSDQEVKEIQLIENIQRADMHPMDEASAFLELIANGISEVEISAKLGKSVYYIRRRLKLNNLTPDWVIAYENGNVNHSDAIKIASFPHDEQLEIYTEEYKEGEPFELDEWNLDYRKYELSSAKFDLNEDYAGFTKCTSCQFNSAVGSLFPEDEKDAICKNKSCFATKSEFAFKLIFEEVKQDPSVILIANTWNIDNADKISWQKDNLEIYSSNHFNQVKEPNIKRYDLDDEDDGAENKKRYIKDLKEYQKEVKNPANIRALNMNGNSKGELIVGTITKGSKPINLATIGNHNYFRDSGDPKERTPEDEINRLASKEARNQQLDGKKVWTKIISLVQEEKNRELLFNTNRLSKEEIYAVGVALKNKVQWGHRDWVDEYFGADEIPTDLSSTKLLGLFRLFVISVLISSCGAHINEGSDNAIAFQVLNKYFPKEIALFELEQQEIAEKRQERVNKRIADLKKKKED